MLKLITTFVENEEGSTAIEYGLIAALVCAVIIAGITNVGDNTENMYNTVTDAILNAG